jgi:hypothetical protein
MKVAVSGCSCNLHHYAQIAAILPVFVEM